MATPLTDSINALTAYANEVTGGSDTTLSDAVHTLASGYGGASDFEVVDRFSFAEDTGEYTFKHTGAGQYIFCEDPILTYAKAIEENRPAYTLFKGDFTIYQTAKSIGMRQGTSLILTSSKIIDYWGTGATINGDSVTIKIAGSNSTLNFRAGINYMILKMKI